MKKCKYCFEEIQDTALKCRFCGEWLDEEQTTNTETEKSIQTGNDAISSNSKKDSEQVFEKAPEKVSNNEEDNTEDKTIYQGYTDRLKIFFFNHKERINRREYIIGHICLMFILLLLFGVLVFLGTIVFGKYYMLNENFSTILGLSVVVMFIGGCYASIILHIKRFHDINQSGFFVLLPFYNIIAPLFFPGNKIENNFGRLVPEKEKVINTKKLLITFGVTICFIVIISILTFGAGLLFGKKNLYFDNSNTWNVPQDLQQESDFGLSYCYFNGKKYILPFDAHCVPDDPNNAWKCDEGYSEIWGEGEAKTQKVCVNNETGYYNYYQGL